MAVPPNPDMEYVETLNRAHVEARQLCLTLEKLYALYECREHRWRYHGATKLRDALYSDWLEALRRKGMPPAEAWHGWPDGGSSEHIPPPGAHSGEHA